MQISNHKDERFLTKRASNRFQRNYVFHNSLAEKLYTSFDVLEIGADSLDYTEYICILIALWLYRSYAKYPSKRECWLDIWPLAYGFNIETYLEFAYYASVLNFAYLNPIHKISLLNSFQLFWNHLYYSYSNIYILSLCDVHTIVKSRITWLL